MRYCNTQFEPMKFEVALCLILKTCRLVQSFQLRPFLLLKTWFDNPTQFINHNLNYKSDQVSINWTFKLFKYQVFKTNRFSYAHFTKYSIKSRDFKLQNFEFPPFTSVFQKATKYHKWSCSVIAPPQSALGPTLDAEILSCARPCLNRDVLNQNHYIKKQKHRCLQ